MVVEMFIIPRKHFKSAIKYHTSRDHNNGNTTPWQSQRLTRQTNKR